MALPGTRSGLKSVQPLIVDDNVQSLEVVTAILMGFGINRSVKCTSAEQAREALADRTFDLVIVDREMPDEDGLGLVRHIRSDPEGSNYAVPILIMSAVTPQCRIEEDRDEGANFTIAKPVSPAVLLDRMLWIARNERPFISTAGYSGPDRRFHTEPLPDGIAERRQTDLALTSKPERALSQDEIDGLFT